MMLGKQRSGRPSSAAQHQQQQQQQHQKQKHMRRTTSLTEFAAPDVLADVAEEEDEELQLLPEAEAETAAAAAAALEADADPYGWAIGAGRADWLAAYRARAAPPLAGLRRNSADFSAAETAAFLRACGLCNRRLGPGRDTFMYRGDTAFCSLECRQRHITIEEWKDKCALATAPTAPGSSDPVVPLPLPPSGAGSDKHGTLTAAS